MIKGTGGGITVAISLVGFSRAALAAKYIFPCFVALLSDMIFRKFSRLAKEETILISGVSSSISIGLFGT